jgi:hypothetical protein
MAHLLFSPQARETRLRRQLAGVLEEIVRSAHATPSGAARSVLAVAPQILLIAAVLRSSLALPDDGVHAVRKLVRDKSGSLYVADPELPEDLFDAEEALGMHGRRPVALAIAAGHVAIPTSPGSRLR